MVSFAVILELPAAIVTQHCVDVPPVFRWRNGDTIRGRLESAKPIMSQSESENEEKGFKVTDRRGFTSDGEPRSDAEESSQKSQSVPEPVKSQAEASTEKPAEEQPKPGEPKPPEVGFLDLVHMLATNALMQLGDVADPVSGERSENLPGVQVMVAFLAMLQEKTKGNLEGDEAKVLEEVLYDLRMRFMTKANLIKS